MTTDRPDDEIDALLAEGRFAAPIRDRVFEGVLLDARLGQAAPDPTAEKVSGAEQ